MSLIFFLFLFIQLHLSPLSSSSSSSTTASTAPHLHATASSCPLDFDVLRRLIQSLNHPKLDSDFVSCHYIKASLRLVQSDYLRTTNNFLPPIDSAESCWVSYQTLINDFFPNFNDIQNLRFPDLLDHRRYTFDQIREATKNFSRLNIIGRCGYGNEYKGVLPDGSEVALKRFKNCSVGGDAIFAHKVEVIASVRHVNLVALRGYCTATTPLEGHQRIIVCDLMRNGSLHDHLFGFEETFFKIYENERERAREMVTELAVTK
ncbi:putative LRR receptor-like serine/threonine-protein kinase RKF3 [Camellia lanceoleosa]|uniref:LRR receptor-like serine/threonine-protein kinase RKF3 n=1 Tax=Camellia lanceoleosa TaxID=1840588 RepID=A0ACC0I3M1_9ERIC|nr:putative LRR receptor-like serine/threonine-protein kinase RKF3 [Camellia lanceoleosa]